MICPPIAVNNKLVTSTNGFMLEFRASSQWWCVFGFFKNTPQANQGLCMQFDDTGKVAACFFVHIVKKKKKTTKTWTSLTWKKNWLSVGSCTLLITSCFSMHKSSSCTVSMRGMGTLHSVNIAWGWAFLIWTVQSPKMCWELFHWMLSHWPSTQCFPCDALNSWHQTQCFDGWLSQ